MDNYESKDISSIPLGRDYYNSNSNNYSYFIYENGEIQL